MKNPFKLIFILVLISAPLFPAEPLRQAQEDHPSRYDTATKAFEDYVLVQMAFDRIPGLSVGFLKDDFTWAKGFGYSNLENLVQAKPKSSFRIASITKTMTAIAVLQLAEEGKIDLDAEIQTYVPYFPRKKWPVTVRQLLGHLGGISHYENYEEEGHFKEPMTTKQAIGVFQGFDLVAEPGTRFNYSSYGYNLLGAAVEEASGLSYGEYIKRRIFERLGMDNSRMDNPLDLIPNRVKGYQFIQGKLKNSEYVDISSRFAAGGVRSTVEDLLKYARGVIEGKLLKEATAKMMFSSLALRNGTLTRRGLGWAVQPWRGHFAASHSGSQPETRTQLLILPVEKFAVAVASNLEGLNLVPYLRRLAELILDEDCDSYAYTSNKVFDSIYKAVYDVFSSGLSYYEWNKPLLAKSQNDLKEAFAYFNNHVNEQELSRNFEETHKKILAGIHQASNQAFTRVGAFMAQALEEKYGREKLLGYHKQGPIAFFSDYITLSSRDAAPKRYPRFKAEFITLVAEWKKDWERTYAEDVRHLVFTPGSDFEGLTAGLKKLFEGASFYPDFTSEFASAGEYYLRINNPDKAVSILIAGQTLYPASPLIHAALGLASFWRGENEAARQFYGKTFDLNSTHSVLSVESFLASLTLLARADKPKEALALGILALEYHPKNVQLCGELGDLSLREGQKDEAREYFRKALKIESANKRVRAKLKALEKQGGVS